MQTAKIVLKAHFQEPISQEIKGGHLDYQPCVPESHAAPHLKALDILKRLQPSFWPFRELKKYSWGKSGRFCYFAVNKKSKVGT